MEDQTTILPESNKTRRIVSNTIYLYVRMFLILVINLFSVRLLFKALGVENYGVYNAVAGVITLLSSVTAVLTSAIQRFYSFYLGRNELSKLRDIYSASFIIYIVFSIFVLLFGETFGLWIVAKKLVIPEVSRTIALWLYQFTLLTFIATLFQVPFSAAVIAHEDMKFYSIVSLVECFLRLVIIFPLFSVNGSLRLGVYGFSLLLVACFILIAYCFKSKRDYRECRLQHIEDRHIFKNLLSFSGWTFYGSIAGTGMIQGNTILVNMFFGPVSSAARAISLQVSSAVSMFSSSFITALRPPMIKSYAEGNHGYLMTLFRMCSITVFYLLLLVSIPLIMEMDSILDLWLDTNNWEATLFSRLMVVYAVLLALHHPFTIIMQAIGKTKEYFVPVDTFTLLSLPVTFILYKLGLPSQATYYTMIIAMALSHIMRMIILKKYYSLFSIRDYLKSFVAPAILVSLISFSLSYIPHSMIENPMARFVSVLGVSSFIILSLSLLISVKKEERALIASFLKQKFSSR